MKTTILVTVHHLPDMISNFPGHTLFTHLRFLTSAICYNQYPLLYELRVCLFEWACSVARNPNWLPLFSVPAYHKFVADTTRKDKEVHRDTDVSIHCISEISIVLIILQWVETFSFCFSFTD